MIGGYSHHGKAKKAFRVDENVETRLDTRSSNVYNSTTFL